MNGKTFFTVIAAIVFLLTFPSASATGMEPEMPDLSDKAEAHFTHIGAGGPVVSVRRVSGPKQFGGDLVMLGGRIFAGRAEDPKLGIMGGTGVLRGNSQSLTMNMAGLSLEDRFLSDPRLKWRVSFGGGTFDLLHRFSGVSMKKGTFAFIEPLAVGVIPMTRHFSLEIGAGYCFSGTDLMKVEGFTWQVNLLVGRR